MELVDLVLIGRLRCRAKPVQGIDDVQQRFFTGYRCAFRHRDAQSKEPRLKLQLFRRQFLVGTLASSLAASLPERKDVFSRFPYEAELAVFQKHQPSIVA